MEVVMKKPFVALLLLLGGTAMWAGSAYAQAGEGNKLMNASLARKLMGARASHLSVSSLGGPETTWVGKSFTDHRAADNYWNIYVGDNLPGTATASNAIWDWDNTVGANAPDSLWGWWPIHRQWVGTGGLTLPDNQRPWHCLDHGNIGNYVISQNVSAKRTFGVIG